MLPLHYYNKAALFSIASSIGTPMKMDEATTTLIRPSLEKLCVEIYVSDDTSLIQFGLDLKKIMNKVSGKMLSMNMFLTTALSATNLVMTWHPAMSNTLKKLHLDQRNLQLTPPLYLTLFPQGKEIAVAPQHEPIKTSSASPSSRNPIPPGNKTVAAPKPTNN